MLRRDAQAAGDLLDGPEGDGAKGGFGHRSSKRDGSEAACGIILTESEIGDIEIADAIPILLIWVRVTDFLARVPAFRGLISAG